jgi:hypothetical protein
METHLRSHITAVFFALAQALPANAQEEKGPYAVTHECAIKVLNDTFTAAVDIIEMEGGVGSIVGAGAANISTLIAINPDTGIISSIDTQLDSVDPAAGISTKALLSYETGAQTFHLTSELSTQSLNDKALAITQTIDDRLRRCPGEMLLGAFVHPSPKIFG